MKTSIDITRVPFSRYGAYVAVTREIGKDGEPDARELVIQTARQRWHNSAAYKISFGSEEPLDFTCLAEPESLKVENESGYARIYFRDDDTVVIESFGLDVRMSQVRWGYGVQTGEREFRLFPCAVSQINSVVVPCGKAILDGPYEDNGCNRQTDLSVACENGYILMALNINLKEPKEIALPILPNKEIAEIRGEWEAFLAKMPTVSTADAEAEEFARLTWYNLWSCFVRADGCYVNDTMLMSKKFMTATWSWDHCFNALAMARMTDKTMAKHYAMSQFLAPFFLQSKLGVLPDMWNPDLETRWGTMKPPIHGWCFSKLMDLFDFDREELETVYTYLVKWTEWWTKTNDTDNDGIPDYPQGCDCGWDNATLFDFSFFVETPDLPAFLILQMRTLARISKALGNTDDEARWTDESETLMKRFMEHSWNGEHFISKKTRTHEFDEDPTCLLSLMPLVLGELLPKDVSDKLVKDLERDYLTDNGLATEMPTSAKYEADGYWRGPIWAPSTYLFVDGLRRGGYGKLARTIAERYCNMSCKKAKGNYENFDALTGKGLRAPGYTWSASVYMMFYWEFGC